MIALKLTDVRTFMNKLLRTEVFDHFLLQEAAIVGASSFYIDGHLNKDFFTEEELEENRLTGLSILPFSFVRSNCFDLIKGKKTPSSFRFVFMLSPENLRKTLTATGSSYTERDISGIYINLRYQNHVLTLTTGISYTIFSLDKTLESQWDTLVKKFLKQNGIEFESMS